MFLIVIALLRVPSSYCERIPESYPVKSVVLSLSMMLLWLLLQLRSRLKEAEERIMEAEQEIALLKAENAKLQQSLQSAKANSASADFHSQQKVPASPLGKTAGELALMAKNNGESCEPLDIDDRVPAEVAELRRLLAVAKLDLQSERIRVKQLEVMSCCACIVIPATMFIHSAAATTHARTLSAEL